MAEDKFEQSKAPGGDHHRLATLVGEWQGQTKTWFEPGKLADESPTQATIREILGGRFVLYEYQGSLMGKPLTGLAILGCYLMKDTYQKAWVDSFHMGTGIMLSEGAHTEKGFSVTGKYEDPGGGPPWGWRTEFEIVDKDHLVVTAYNISPDGEEAKAVETSYKREK